MTEGEMSAGDRDGQQSSNYFEANGGTDEEQSLMV